MVANSRRVIGTNQMFHCQQDTNDVHSLYLSVNNKYIKRDINNISVRIHECTPEGFVAGITLDEWVRSVNVKSSWADENDMADLVDATLAQLLRQVHISSS